MPLPRVRFTVRRMMVAGAVFSVFAAVVHLRSLSLVYHERCEMHYLAQLHSWPEDGPSAVYHASMLAKYQFAASHPWLPVPPDPPEPE
jgi:hypothetical protein